jgi:hypothetical protein
MRTGYAAMIAALLLWNASQSATTPAAVVHYRDVPLAVVSAAIYRWPNAGAPVRVASIPVQQGRSIDLTASAGLRVLVALLRTDGSYLVDGPFVWPDRENDRTVDGEWRRTVAGGSQGGPAVGTPLEWVTARHDGGGAWPRCLWASADRWECWGATMDDIAVVYASGPGGVWWTVASAADVRDWRVAEWGRLLTIRGRDGLAPNGLRVIPQQPVPPPAQRLRSVRLQTASIDTIHATPITETAVWLAGARPPARSWAELRATGDAPTYLPLQDLSAGPPGVRVPIVLDEARRIDGTVSAAGEPARGALVTLFRLLDPPPQPNDRIKPRRVFAAESTTGDDGAYRFEELGDADYEIVAWHPQRGRASVIVPPARANLDIELVLPGIARGRVLQDGKPASGVDIFSMPDPNAFNAADDPVDVKGGDGRTGADGRFVVSLAASGGGGLRIGGGAYSVRRVPLPSAVMPIVDLGDIELGASFEVTVVLDRDPVCGLRAVGPVGRTGLHVLTAVRTGPGLFRIAIPEEGLWEFGLTCGAGSRALAPPAVRIDAASAGKEVHLAIK